MGTRVRKPGREGTGRSLISCWCGSEEGAFMPDLALNLVVIRSADLERAARFYGALGLSFVKEKHGDGPEHYAGEIGPTVFEIYPCTSEARSSAGVRFGFRVPSLEAALAALTAQGA